MLSGHGIELSGAAGSWQGTPHCQGCLDAVPPCPAVLLIPAASSSLPRASLTPSLKSGLPGTTCSWKMCICVVRHALQGYRQDISGPKHTPQFLISSPMLWSCPVFQYAAFARMEVIKEGWEPLEPHIVGGTSHSWTKGQSAEKGTFGES